MPKQDYYDILGINKNASIDEIKKAYRKQALEHHPDRNKGDKGSEEQFKKVNEAYQVLSDPEKRKQYDTFGSYQETPGGQAGGFQGFDFSNFQGGSFGGFEDIFETFFGNSFGGGRQSRTRRSTQGEDINLQLHITFEEAVFGVEKEITVQRQETCTACTGSGVEPGSKMINCITCGGTGQVEYVQRSFLGSIRSVAACSTCGGEGKVPEKKCATCHGEGRVIAQDKITVSIPSGVENGSVLRVSGKGQAGKKGSASGDLFLHMLVEPSKKFQREGKNIYTDLEISNVQAVLGGEVNVDTVYGKKTVKIPKGIQEGEMIRLKGLGIKETGGTGTGDHYLRVRIKIPKKLSKKEEELYQELMKLGQGKKGWF